MASLRMTAAVVTALLVGVAPTAARANGRFPAASQLVVSPENHSRLVLRTTFGLLVSADDGANWDWICEKAIGYVGIEDPAIAIAGSDRVIAGLFSGLSTSPDGCRWSRAGELLANRVVVDVAARRSQPSVAVAISSRPAGAADAALAENIVFVTKDSGATWRALETAIDPTLLLETIDVTESDPDRLYVSGVRDRGGRAMGVLLVSTDAGRTWSERAVPLDPVTDRAPFIAAVDPTDADRLYVRTSGSSKNRLLVTEDAGRTFKTVFVAQGSLLGFALSADGSNVYFGGPNDGLYMASRSVPAVVKKSDVPVRCLATSENTLWACSDMSAGFVLGASVDNGAHFDPKLRLDGIRGPLACGAETNTSTCAEEWSRMRSLLATSAEARTDGGVEGGPHAAAKCDDCDAQGCAMAASAPLDDATTGFVAALLAAWAWMVRRGRAQRRRIG